MTQATLNSEFFSKNKQSLNAFGQKPPSNISSVCSVILGGGQGSRLFPLTLSRCKPAISFGGKYRLIDVPISNSLNSGINKIFVITQFLSTSLHPHIFKTYKFSSFSNGFIEVLAAEEKPYRKNWYQGTGDAVRQNLDYLLDTAAEYFLILSGDQLYNLNFQSLLSFAQSTDADLVVCSLPVPEKEVSRLGVLKIDNTFKITNFYEKPQDEEILNSFALSSSFDLKKRSKEERFFLGSMGIYLFKRKALMDLLLNDTRNDFGSHLIPTQIAKGKTFAFLYDGYWEDIGTIESYYRANLALTYNRPNFDWYLECNQMISNDLRLPPPKISNCSVRNSIICEGAIVDAEEVYQSILGPRTVVHKGCKIRNTYVMGNDFYAAPNHQLHPYPKKLHIGKNTQIEKAIIDKHVYIGDNVSLVNKKGIPHLDKDNLYVRDGIILVPKGAYIPDNFEF